MDTAEVLEAAEGVLDEVTAAITFLVVADGALAAAPAGITGTAPASRSERRSWSATSKVTDIHVASAQLLRDANYDVDDDVLVPSEELQLFEFVDQMNLAHGVDKYWLVGRRVENASRESAFGFVIE
jgi:hypothetical protein